MTAESDWSPAGSFSQNLKPQFLLSDNAFYPIKDDYPSDEGHPPRLTDASIRPLENRISALEKSRNKLEELIAQANAASKPKKEDLLRSNTDLITHLSYKVQVMSESIASLKGKVQGMEEKSDEHRSSVSKVEKSLSNIEKNVLPSQDNVLSRQSSELLTVRDLIADLRDKLDNQQRLKHRNDNDNDELNSKISNLKNLVERISEKQNKAEKELERALKRRQDDDEEREELTRKMIKDICQKVIDENLHGRMNKMEKRLAENQDAQEEFHRKLHVKENGKTSEPDNRTGYSGGDLKKFQEQVKVDKARTNASLQKLNDAMINMTEKQMEEQKINQEKFQSEVLSRQKFECEVLKRLNASDEKLEEIGNKREKLKADILHQFETLDSARLKALDDLDEKVNLLAKKKTASKSEFGSQSKESLAESIRILRQDVHKTQDSMKDVESKLLSNSVKIKEFQVNMKDVNKQLDGLESFRRETLSTLDRLAKKIKDSGANTLRDADDLSSPAKKKTEPRKEEIEKLQQQINDLQKAEKEDKADRDKIRSLANSIQLLKGLVAMKLQHEEKAREEAVDHLQKQIDDVEDSVEELKSSKMNSDDEEDDEPDGKAPGRKKDGGTTNKNSDKNGDNGGKQKRGTKNEKDGTGKGNDDSSEKAVPGGKKTARKQSDD